MFDTRSAKTQQSWCMFTDDLRQLLSKHPNQQGQCQARATSAMPPPYRSQKCNYLSRSLQPYPDQRGWEEAHFVLCKPAEHLLYGSRATPWFARFLGSSVVEHSTVNRMAAGSNPARGASSIVRGCSWSFANIVTGFVTH